MANDPDWKRELGQLAEKLRDPFRMRMTVAAVAVVIMFLAISDPIQGRISDSAKDLRELKSKVRIGEEVMLLRDHWHAVEDRIIKGKGNDVVVSHLIDIIRQQQVELNRIDTQKAERLNSMYSIRVLIDVTGQFDALLGLLYELDTNQYLIRVESVAITPPSQEETVSTMNLSLRVLKEET